MFATNNPAASFPYHYNFPEWDDRRCEATADAWIRSGAYVPQWRWPVGGPYNGATGQQRVEGWQKVRVACNKGLMPNPKMCSVCGSTGNIQYHNENYFRPLNCRPICAGCHRVLHGRFARPGNWHKLAQGSAYEGAWFLHITMRELTTEQAVYLAGLDNPMDARQLE